MQQKHILRWHFWRTIPQAWRRLCNQHRWLAPTLRWLVVYGLLFWVAWGRIDPDFGWHLQSGFHIRAHGIPAHDIYTYTAPNFPWIDHEWGNDVIVSLLFSGGGVVLMSLFYTALWTGSLALNAGKARLGILLAAVTGLVPFAGVRVVAWTALFLALVIRISASKRRRIRWLIPLLFILWANIHGGFAIGFVYLAYLAVTRRDWRWLAVLGLSVPATFINPYGVTLYVEIARTLFDSSLHDHISEWKRFSIPRADMLYVVLWGCGFWLYCHKHVRKWFSWGPLLFVASMSAVRNMPLFIVGTLHESGEWLHTIRSSIHTENMARGQKIVLSLLALGLFGGILASLDAAFWPPHSRSNMPKSAVTYLAAHPCSGHLFNNYDYGGYLIWQLPSEPVYIDGRMPSWKDPHGQLYYNHYTDILTKPAVRKSQFQTYNIRCAIVSTGGNFSKFVTDVQGSGWRVVFKDEHSLVLKAPGQQ